MIKNDKATTALKAEFASRQRRVFTAKDRAVLAHYCAVAEVVAGAFGPGCEVVVHSFEDLSASIVKIVNGQVSGRSVGSPISDFGLKMADLAYKTEETALGPYFIKTRAGKPLKIMVGIIRSEKKEPLGLLCVNFDLATPLIQVLRHFIPLKNTPDSEEEIFAPNVTELVEQAVAGEFETIVRQSGVSPTEKNRRIVSNLEAKGVFRIKGSVELVAGELGVTKHTIYKYLRGLRGS